MKWFCDVLVVGGGGGAIRAAIAAKEAKPDSRVLLVTKGFFGHSGVTAISCSDRWHFMLLYPTLSQVAQITGNIMPTMSTELVAKYPTMIWPRF